MPKEQIELKLGAEEKRMMKKLITSLDKVARSMQLYMPQKPKNSEIRLTEPANLEETISEGERLVKLSAGTIKKIADATGTDFQILQPSKCTGV